MKRKLIEIDEYLMLGDKLKLSSPLWYSKMWAVGLTVKWMSKFWNQYNRFKLI
jgi:hypothetical protein